MQPFFRYLLLIAFLFAFPFALATPLVAQSQPVTQTTSTKIITADDVNKIASELWCPLCSGVRLDSCELQACEQMREEIAIKLQAGEDLASIKQYFLARYGEQVLGAPQRQGWGWLAWLLPPIVIVAAGALLFVRGRDWIKPASTVVPAKNGAPKTDDPYEEKLNEELARYE